MNKFKDNAATGTSFGILLALSFSHLANDTLQSVISAVYPLLKESLALSFAQIGLITLVYQISASVFQPVVGFYLDKRPNPWFLPVGMTFTMTGLTTLAFAHTVTLTVVAVFLVGIGSSILHPEASRLTSIASGGKRGMAQSLFQVGGNLGGIVRTFIGCFDYCPIRSEAYCFILYIVCNLYSCNDSYL